jgi:hypothetical protein
VLPLLPLWNGITVKALAFEERRSAARATFEERTMVDHDMSDEICDGGKLLRSFMSKQTQVRVWCPQVVHLDGGPQQRNLRGWSRSGP